MNATIYRTDVVPETYKSCETTLFRSVVFYVERRGCTGTTYKTQPATNSVLLDTVHLSEPKTKQ